MVNVYVHANCFSLHFKALNKSSFALLQEIFSRFGHLEDQMQKLSETVYSLNQ